MTTNSALPVQAYNTYLGGSSLIHPPLPQHAGQLDYLPLLMEPAALAELPACDDFLIVDVRSAEQCIDGHIPGAVRLDYAALVARKRHATGAVPEQAYLSRLLSDLGLGPDRHVVAYNDDNGSHAARLLWTLEILGHTRYSLLNGGFAAWDDLELPVTEVPRQPVKTIYSAALRYGDWVGSTYILENLGNPDMVLLDTRSAEEYRGKQVRAARGGHIPGAINLDWSLSVDLTDNCRLRPESELIDLLNNAGVTADKEIVPYCQSHHRSAHTCFVLKHLGFPRVRAYPGSWSEWGNRADTPVETSGALARRSG